MNIHFIQTLIITFMLMTMSSTFISAQDNNRRIDDYRWHIELGGSIDFLQDKLQQFHHNKLGAGLHFETRYRIGQSPIDVGLYGNLSAVPRVHRTTFYNEIIDENNQPIGTIQGYGESDTGFSSINLMATVGFNHRLNNWCEAFAGAGIGICSYKEGKKLEIIEDDALSTTIVNHGGTSLAVMPRIGVQLFNHLRLTAGYKFQEKANRRAFVSVGFVIPIGKR